jgi:linoleoyl-CoA desaturase
MRVKFAPSEGFYSEMKARVEAYFASTGKMRRDNPTLYLKIGLLLAWFVGTYILLVFVASTWWQAVPLAVSLGFAMAGIGFNLGHDGSHGSASGSCFVNGAMARTFDLMGGSSYIWHWKHNVFHHSYPNIVGADEDIDCEPVARLSPYQPRYWFHRYQFLYMWMLYGLLPVKWQFFDDFKCVARRRIAKNEFPLPTGWGILRMLAGKIVFFSWALVLPLLLYPFWIVALVFLLASITLGVTLSVVFQLAHATEEAYFPQVSESAPRCEQEWAIHQVRTTVDFARGSRLLDWYLGGLNYQIEHHLFPHITHVHYPALAPIVEGTCQEFGVRYFAHRTFLGAVLSHQRWLRRMGRPATGADDATPALESARVHAVEA